MSDLLTRAASAFRRAILGIPAREATFERRAFVRGEPTVVAHLELVGETFLTGYNAAVARGAPERLAGCLWAVPASHRGFAVEGAAMAFTLLDWLVPTRRDRLQRFLENDATDHPYMAHVGAGWALARLPLNQLAPHRQDALERLDPLLRWLAVDGYGFHEAYFHRQRVVGRRWRPGNIVPYADRAFDQGVGRSLWFSECADPWRVHAAIGRFPEPRRADLWSGAGLACAYAGGASDSALDALAQLGDEYAMHLAQGAAFAAATRVRARNLVDHTRRACRILCRCEPEEAAAVTDACLANLPESGPMPAFETWRRRIAARLAPTRSTSQPVVIA